MKVITKLFVFLLAAFVVSCSGDDSSESNNNNGNPQGFVWKENGGSTALTATNATFSEQYKTFIVKGSDNSLQFEINLTATGEGVYDVTTGNVFTYTKVNPYFVAASGTVEITQKTNGKVSGTFDVSGDSSGITSLKGTFTDIEIVQ
jgi:hypothetical protein